MYVIVNVLLPELETTDQLDQHLLTSFEYEKMRGEIKVRSASKLKAELAVLVINIY